MNTQTTEIDDISKGANFLGSNPFQGFREMREHLEKLRGYSYTSSEWEALKDAVAVRYLLEI